MFRLAVTFFIISIVAAYFGFGRIAETTADMSILLFWIFFVVFLATLIFGLLDWRQPKI